MANSREFPLHTLIENRAGEKKIKEFILLHPEELHAFRESQGVLDQAIFRKDLALIKLLVEAGASINKGDPQLKMTPLHLACRHGQLEIVDYLLRKGGQMHKKDPDGWSAMHFAIEGESIEVAERLLEHLADRKNKKVPLHELMNVEEILNFAENRADETFMEELKVRLLVLQEKEALQSSVKRVRKNSEKKTIRL